MVISLNMWYPALLSCLLGRTSFLPLHPKERQLRESTQTAPEIPPSRMLHDPLQQLDYCHPDILPRVKQPQAQIEQPRIALRNNREQLQYSVILQLLPRPPLRIVVKREMLDGVR